MSNTSWNTTWFTESFTVWFAGSFTSCPATCFAMSNEDLVSALIAALDNTSQTFTDAKVNETTVARSNVTSYAMSNATSDSISNATKVRAGALPDPTAKKYFFDGHTPAQRQTTR